MSNRYIKVVFESGLREYTYKYLGSALLFKNQLVIVQVPNGFKYALAKVTSVDVVPPKFLCKYAYEDLSTMRTHNGK